MGVELHGHRGARGLLPENTLVGFHEALRHGVECIEFDVGMSADGAIVIHHDRTLNPDIARRNGNWIDARPPPLKSLALSEIASYDVGRLKPGTPYAAKYPRQKPVDGARIPILADLLAVPALKDNAKVCFNIEIKTSPLAPDETHEPTVIANALVRVLDDHGVRARSRIQSFDWRSLRHLRKIAPDIPLSFLTAEQSWLDNVARGAAGQSPWLGGIDIDAFDGSIPKAINQAGGAIWAPYFRDLTAGDLATAHELGLEVIVWTVNDADDMRAMINLGVDGIITDYPDIGRRIIDELALQQP